MNKISKIFGTIFLLGFVSLIIYLGSSLNTKRGYEIKVIDIQGNILLPADQYYKFAKLDNDVNYKDLNLAKIKSRIEKHPYISSAVVKYDGDDKVIVKVFEKKLRAIVFKNDQQFLITNNFQLLPILPFTKQIDIPVLSNPKILSKLKINEILNKNIDILTSFKIISTLKFVSPELYALLSEIDLRDGKDIMITFSSLPYPIVIGRGDEIRKTFYFSTLWSYLKGNELNSMLNYVDLRYKNHVYLGLSEPEEEKTI